MKPDFPLIHQEPLSLVVVSYSDLEAIALRSILEYFNYRVEIHWIGSRPQFLEVLQGNIPTFHYIVLSCHGDETGILVPGQESVSSENLSQSVKLPGKIVLGLGCLTGTKPIANAFLKGGCEAYIAPTDFIEGNAALLFAIHLFYFLADKRTLGEAVDLSQQHDDQCALFKLYLPASIQGNTL